MGKHKSCDFMISFVQDYLSGTNSRLDWDLDFNYYLIEHYPAMERENLYLAECFAEYISEQGFDRAEQLDDAEHKAFIRRQFALFTAALNDGLG